jgi:hypothetical protein
MKGDKQNNAAGVKLLHILINPRRRSETMTTRAKTHLSPETTGTPTLLVACEWGVRTWRLGFTTGVAPRPRERQVPAGAVHAVLVERDRAKQRFDLPEHTRVVSCYEAGWDGFWLHRFLVGQGVENLVVDSSSIEVNRRQRRAKTDRLDAHQRRMRLQTELDKSGHIEGPRGQETDSPSERMVRIFPPLAGPAQSARGRVP